MYTPYADAAGMLPQRKAKEKSSRLSNSFVGSLSLLSIPRFTPTTPQIRKADRSCRVERPKSYRNFDICFVLGLLNVKVEKFEKKTY